MPNLVKPLRQRVFSWIKKILLAVGFVSVLQIIPWSPMMFFARRADRRIISRSPIISRSEDLLSEADLRGLPAPVKKYAKKIGWVGTPWVSFMRITTQASKMHIAGIESPVRMRFTQITSAHTPERQRFARGRTAGLALEARDSFVGGSDILRVFLGRFVPILNRRGRDMDSGALANWIAEAILIPGALFNRPNHVHQVRWVEIDDLSAGIVVRAFGLVVEGVFTFDDDGLVRTFTTDDRPYVVATRKTKTAGWTMTYDQWTDTAGGKLPTSLGTIWHVGDEDISSLTTKNASITFW